MSRYNEFETPWWILPFVAAVILIAILAIANAPDGSGACHSVNNFGMRGCRVTDTSYLHVHCGQDDTVEYGVSATNSAGQEVDLIVCCGTWKGCTVRSR